MNRAALALTTAILIVSIVIFLTLPLLAYRWAQLPFMGAFVEQTLVFNSVGSQGGARWSGIDAGLRFPHHLMAVSGQPLQSTSDLARALAVYHPGETVTLAYHGKDGGEQLTSITLQTFPTYDLFAYFVVPYLVGLAYLAIGLWVYRTRRGETTGRAFVLFCAAIAVLVGGLFDLYTTHIFSWAWTLALPAAAGALFILALTFPQEISLVARHPALRWLGFIPAGMLAAAAEWVLYDARRPTAYAAAWRNEFAFAAASILVFLGFTLYRRMRAPSPIAREQARIILWGSALAFGPIVYFLLLRTARVSIIFNVSLYFPPLVIFPLVVAYTMLRYRLLDTDRLVTRGLAYTVLGALAGVAYAALLAAASIVTGAAIPADNPFLIALFVFALVFAFHPLRDRLQRQVDALFLRGSRAYREHLQAFGYDLTTAADLQQVVLSLQRQIESAVRPAHAHVFLRAAATGDPSTGAQDRFAAYQTSVTSTELSTRVLETSGVHEFDADGGLARTLAARRGALYLAPDTPRPSSLAHDQERLAQLGSSVFIPFPDKVGLAGWLALGPKLSGEPYTREDLVFLESLGDQAALAFERARLFEAEQRRGQAISALLDISETIGSTLDLPRVLDMIVLSARHLLPVDRVVVFLWDKAGDCLVPSLPSPESPVRLQLTREQTDRFAKLRLCPEETPIVGELQRSRQVIALTDAAESPLLPPGMAQTFDIRSLLAAPLLVRAQFVGALYVDCTRQRHVFSADEIELAMGLARQAALAIERARLFAEARQRVMELSSLQDVGAAVAGNLRLEDVLELVVRSAAELTVGDEASVSLLSPDGRTRTYVACFGEHAAFLRGKNQPSDAGLHGAVVATGQPLLVNDVAADPRMTSLGREVDIHHVIIVPLQAKGRIIGTLSSFGSQPGHAFTEHDLRLLSAFANQVAITIGNARLFQAERAQAQRQAALLRLSAELAAALEEAEVCQCVVRGLHDTLGYDYLGLFMVDEDTGERVLCASIGWPDAPTDWRIPPDQGVSERALLDGKLHYTPDVTRDPRYVPGLNSGAEVDVPLHIGEEVLGVLVVESSQPNAFNQDDFEVLTAAANQTSLAIGRARLLAAERRRVNQLDALRATLADISAELEFPNLLRAVLERAVALLDATGGDLGLYDRERQEIVVLVSHNMGKDFAGTRMELGEGVMGHVAETGEPVIVANYSTWEGHSLQYMAGSWDAVIAAPFMVRGRLVGAIGIVDSNPARRFTPSDLNLLTLFAHQAAVAVENARLFGEVQQLAITDSLTGLYNRRHFFELAEREFDRARRYARPLSAIMLDLDRFKQVNDTYGHAIGDQVLQEVARRCQKNLREIDILGRYGGEEFTILLPENDLTGARSAAERLRQCVAESPIDSKRGAVTITVSLGVAIAEDCPNLSTLLDRADAAMYAAKQSGGNKVGG